MSGDQEIISAVRGLTGIKVVDPENNESSIFASRLLPKLADFIALERDETRNLEAFLARLDSFVKALPPISFDGGSTEQQRVLAAECLYDPDENILALARCELSTIIEDFRRQLRGSSQEVSSDGTLPDNSKPPSELPLDLVKGDMERDQNPSEPPKVVPPLSDQAPGSIPPRAPDPREDNPPTWRDSIKRQSSDDFEREPGTDDWRSSLDTPAFNVVDDEWRSSLGKSELTDDYIAEVARTDFDREMSGDSHGYMLSLVNKLDRARNFLEQLRVVSDYFNYTLKLQLGYGEPRQ